MKVPKLAGYPGSAQIHRQPEKFSPRVTRFHLNQLRRQSGQGDGGGNPVIGFSQDGNPAGDFGKGNGQVLQPAGAFQLPLQPVDLGGIIPQAGRRKMEKELFNQGGGIIHKPS